MDAPRSHQLALTQPRCDWQQFPELIGSVVQVLPQALDEDYPYDCAQGLVGSADPTFQVSSRCAGACVAGFYCQNPRTLHPLLCPVSSWCGQGSSVPTPCPAGTAGRSEGLTGANQCEVCGKGTWCSAGMSIDCPENTYNDETGSDNQGACLPCSHHSASPPASTSKSAWRAFALRAIMIPMEIHPSCLIASPAQLAPIALGWATRLKRCPCFRATGDYHVTRLTYASALTSTRAIIQRALAAQERRA